MELDDSPRSVGNIEEEELDGELLIYHPEHGKIFTLNGTAAFIWSVCNGTRKLKEVADILHDEAPDQPRDNIERDVLEFADNLSDEGLLEAGGDE